jgi:hypothetical protein
MPVRYAASQPPGQSAEIFHHKKQKTHKCFDQFHMPKTQPEEAIPALIDCNEWDQSTSRTFFSDTRLSR